MIPTDISKTNHGASSPGSEWCSPEKLATPEAGKEIFDLICEDNEHIMAYESQADFESVIYDLARERSESLLASTNRTIAALRKSDQLGDPMKDVERG